MPNQYVEFVRQWSKDNGLSYMCAVSNPQLKIDYKKFKAGEPYGDFEAEVNPRKKPIERKPVKQMLSEMIKKYYGYYKKLKSKSNFSMTKIEAMNRIENVIDKLIGNEPMQTPENERLFIQTVDRLTDIVKLISKLK